MIPLPLLAPNPLSAFRKISTRIRREQMSREFRKYHLEGPWEQALVLHHFTGIDRGGPHDHPFGFTSTVLSGGYVEEVFHIEGGGWRSERIARLPGTTHQVEARHIHQIVELPEGECWTLITPGPPERITRFWQFDEQGIRSRRYNQRKYRPHVGEG